MYMQIKDLSLSVGDRYANKGLTGDSDVENSMYQEYQRQSKKD
jgi:hypothetical protein